MPTAIFCPFCHKHIAPMIARASYTYLTYSGYTNASWFDENGIQWWIGICNYCKKPMLIRDSGDIVYPYQQPALADSRIPSDIATDLNESKMCLSVDCYRAAATMARRCIQSACLALGAPDADPYDQIKYLFDKHQITKDLSDWANAVRCLGRDGAHPHREPVDKVDAEDAVSLADKFCEVLFVVPKIAQAQRAQRDRKKRGGNNGS